MTDSLLHILFARLDQTETEVGIGLQGFVNHTLEQLSAGEEVTLIGLGFLRIDDGTIVFEPEEAFATAVNAEYDRLPVIEIGAVEIAEVLPVEDEAEETVEELPIEDETTEIVEEDLSPEETEVEDSGTEQVAEIHEPEEETLEETAEEEPGTEDYEEVSPPPVEETVDSHTPEPVEAEASAPDVPFIPPPPVSESHSDRRSPGRRSSYDRRRRSHSSRSIEGSPLVGAVLLILLSVIVVVSIVFLQNRSSSKTENIDTLSKEQVVTDENDGAVSLDDSVTAVSEGEDDTSAEQAPPVTKTGTARAEPDEQKRLSDTSFDSSIEGYTLIVGSVKSHSDAESAILRFRSLGFPTGVLPYSSNTRTGFRMAVGVFTTIAEADTMRTRLRDRLPDGTWVFRIR